LIWVFNDNHEFKALSEALGADQPLIGLRSLNAIVRLERLYTWVSRSAAAVYAAELLPWLARRACFVGGNCQGTVIAAELARELLLAGIEVRGFIGMEWAELPALPLRSTLLFGEQSTDHNPFLQGRDLWPHWRRLSAAVHCEFLAGRHGTYFDPERIGALAAAVDQALRRPPVAIESPRPAVEPESLPAIAPAGARLLMRLRLQSDLQHGDEFALLWDSHFAGQPHRQIVRPQQDPHLRGYCLCSVPQTPGIWTLQTYLCRENQGPRSWAADTRRFHQLQVVGEAPIGSLAVATHPVKPSA